MTAMDIFQRDDLGFPRSLPEFQRHFPGDAACAAYLEHTRWPEGFVCRHCGVIGEPFRIATRPGDLECRSCRRQTGLLVGTVMERSHMPLSVWFWAAYLLASQTQGVSAVQFQRQLGLSRYETAFGLLHKLRAAMVRPIRTGSVDLLTSTSRSTKPGLVAEPAAKGGVSITRRWWPLPLKFAIESLALPKTAAGTGAMREGFDWPLSPTGALMRLVGS